jgi:hypothetical protein
MYSIVEKQPFISFNNLLEQQPVMREGCGNRSADGLDRRREVKATSVGMKINQLAAMIKPACI